jgi:glycosyltransferase involved in cell wall biosynthesis
MNSREIPSQINATFGNGESATHSPPLASIIIPTYNHGRFLGDAICSVLQQTYKHFKIIVVDDGSEDNTREVAAGFGDLVRYIWQENRGLSAARNTGIRAAKGEMIGLLDADDQYEPEFLATLVAVLESNPDLDGVFCSARTIDTNDNILPQRIGQAVQPSKFRDKLLAGGFFPPLCMLAYKYCYDGLDHLFDESLTAVEDWDMWLRFSERYKILGLDEPLVRYRIVPGSMSRDPERMSSNRQAVIHKHFANEPAERSQWSQMHRRALGYTHVRAAIESLQEQDHNRASYNIRQAFAIYPDLAYSVEVFYELGLGAQPQGYRGTPFHLQLEDNVYWINQILSEVFKPPVVFDSTVFKSKACGTAHYAISLLAYNVGQLSMSRFHLLRSLLYRPELWREVNILRNLTRTFAGQKRLAWFRKVRQNTEKSEIK